MLRFRDNKKPLQNNARRKLGSPNSRSRRRKKERVGRRKTLSRRKGLARGKRRRRRRERSN